MAVSSGGVGKTVSKGRPETGTRARRRFGTVTVDCAVRTVVPTTDSRVTPKMYCGHGEDCRLERQYDDGSQETAGNNFFGVS